MPLISVTRLRVRSAWFLPEFFIYAMRSSRQAQRSPGFLMGRLVNDARRTFWTITVWDDEKSMREYRGTAAHGKAMPKLAKWCDEASVVHWAEQNARIPDITEAHARMQEQGRASRVDHPSPEHLSRRIALPIARGGPMLRPLHKAESASSA